jgi:telomerase reverse transcriptase
MVYSFIEYQLIVPRIAKARSHMIYTDTQLNGLHTAYVNVYQSFIITALKMHHYIMGWGTNVAKNAKFLNSRLNLIYHP